MIELDLDKQGRYYYLLLDQSEFNPNDLNDGFLFVRKEGQPYKTVWFDYDYCKSHAEAAKESKIILKIAITIRKAEQFLTKLLQGKPFEELLPIQSIEKFEKGELK